MALNDANLMTLSSERITAVLDSLHISHATDADGDLLAGFEGGYFHFLRGGQNNEYLTVRGTYDTDLAPTHRTHASVVCEEWNRTTLWPKTFPVVVSADSGDAIRVSTEHTVAYDAGVTDAQLASHIMCAISTSLQFFAKLGEEFAA